MKTERATRFLFSAEDLLPDDRLAIWLDDLGHGHMRLELVPHDISTRDVPGASNDSFAFSWVTPSDYRIVGPDGTTQREMNSGILLLYGEAGACATEGPARLTNVRLDGALVRSKISDIDERPLLRFPADSAALRLLQAYVDVLAAIGIPADPVLAHGINEHIVDLIAASLRSGDDDLERAAAGATASARLAAAKSDIRTHLADPMLSARHVAQRLGLSERSIYLLFERSGLSLSSFVTDERLKRATAMLLDPAQQQQRIGDIALAAGFSDLSTFNRSFRRRYGRTPSSLRRRGADQGSRRGSHDPG